jgi:hypothetical protein
MGNFFARRSGEQSEQLAHGVNSIGIYENSLMIVLTYGLNTFYTANKTAKMQRYSHYADK